MITKILNSRRMVQLGLSVAITIGLSACASSNVVKMTEGAPITYKMGQGSAKYAAITLPNTRAKRPRAINRGINAPKSLPYTPEAYIPRQMEPAGPEFSPYDVDKRLYAHQKVGKPYSVYGKSYTPRHNPTYDRSGLASWYGEKFHGRPTATGETYNMNDITAAHKTLPLNSVVHVENLENGRSLLVRVNDRGPFVDGRIIDLSKGAATALGTLSNGVAQVRVRYVGPADPNSAGRQVSAPPVFEQPAAPLPAQPLFEEPYFEAPAPAKPQVSLPTVPQDYFDIPAPQVTDPLPAEPVFPSAPMADPYADLAPHTGGQMTLTIKGPIHIAKHGSNDNKPKLIRTINHGRHKAN